MKPVSRVVVVIAAAIVMLGVFLGARAIPANAQITTSFCVEAVSLSQCLNDWNGAGSGNEVRLDPIGNPNEFFGEQVILGRCSDGHVNATCPFANTHFDSEYNSYPIVQIVESTGVCVATGAPDEPNIASLGKCNDASQGGTGKGGANGTVFIDHNGYMINLYWTNQGQYGNNAACMQPEGTGASSFVYLDLPTDDGCAQWTDF